MNADENTASTSSETTATKSSRRRKTARAKSRPPRAGRSGTKLEAARVVFSKEAGKKPRKEVIEAMCDKADLTPATASAYYQRLAHDTHLKRGSVPRATYSRKGGGDTKASVARAIFRKIGARKARKDVIEQLMKQAKLTQAGASTYYQKLKQEAA